MNPIGIEAFLKIGGDPIFVSTKPEHQLTLQERLYVRGALRNKRRISIYRELSLLLLLCGVHDCISDTYLAENIPLIVSFLIDSEDKFSRLLLALEYYEQGKPCYEMRIHFLYLLVKNLELHEQVVSFTPYVLSKEFWLKSFTDLMKPFNSTQVHSDQTKQICKTISYHFFTTWKHHPELKLCFLDRMVQLGLFTGKTITIPRNMYITSDFEFQFCPTEVMHYLFYYFPEETNASHIFEELFITNYFLINPQKTEFMLTHPGYRPGFLEWIIQTDFSPDFPEAATYVDLSKVAKWDELLPTYKEYLKNRGKFNSFLNVCTSDLFYVMLHSRHGPDLSREHFGGYYCIDGYNMNKHFDALRELILSALWFHLRKDELFYTTTFQHSCMILNGESVPDLLQQRLAKFDATIRENIRILYSFNIIPDFICNIIQNIYFPPHHEYISHIESTYLHQTVFSLCKVNTSASVNSKKKKSLIMVLTNKVSCIL